MSELEHSVSELPTLAKGWSIRRDAIGEGLSMLVTDLNIALMDKPGAEVRIVDPPKPSYRGIGVSLLNGAEVRYQVGLHATSLEEAEASVLPAVPTLAQNISGQITHVFSTSNDKGERFLTVDFNQDMREVLHLERDLILGALNNLMHPETRRPWRAKPLDFTLAYFSRFSSDSAVKNAKSIARKHLPLSFTARRAVFYPSSEAKAET